MRRIVTYVLVPALAVAVVFAPLWSVRLNADVNGDRTVDVLDAQALVAEAFAAQRQQCDMNADGVMDVLDLQRVLGGGEGANFPREDEPTPVHDATLPQQAGGPLQIAAMHPGAILVMPPTGDPVLDAATPRLDGDVCPVANARQYLRELTPHAPPPRA